MCQQRNSLGSKKTDVTNSYQVLTIPSYKIVVVEKDGTYNLMQTNGKEIIGGTLDSIYMMSNTATGENTFYMTYNGKTDNIEERLAGWGL